MGRRLGRIRRRRLVYKSGVGVPDFAENPLMHVFMSCGQGRDLVVALQRIDNQSQKEVVRVAVVKCVRRRGEFVFLQPLNNVDCRPLEK